MPKYLLNILLSLDQFINVLFCGDPNETISSRIGKRYPTLVKIVDTIFFWDKNHSRDAAEYEEGPNSVSSEDRWQVLLFWSSILLICFII